MGDPNLVTTYTFHGQEYLFKMNVLNNNLEILITDKNSGEEWQCSYDATYIENLTQKTGNFKQFDIFVAMIKSGLLRTSESVSLDLLTFEDLEVLRSRKITKSVAMANTNRRYLIVTYVVEFDKIRYPLPLEYCGPPDPAILQATIRRLEVELAKTREELVLKNNNHEAKKLYYLQKRVDELTEDNAKLLEELRQLQLCWTGNGKKAKPRVVQLQKAVSNLEKSVVIERNSHHDLVEKLRLDNIELARQLEKLRSSERSLRLKLNKALSQSSRIGVGDHYKRTAPRKPSTESVRMMFKRVPSPQAKDTHKQDSYRIDLPKAKSRDKLWLKSRGPTTAHSVRVRSRSSSASSTNKYWDPEVDFAASSSTSCRIASLSHMPRENRTKSASKSRNSSRNSSSKSSAGCGTPKRTRHKQQLDYKKLEEKIEHLQKMLKSNLVRDF